MLHNQIAASPIHSKETPMLLKTIVCRAAVAVTLCLFSYPYSQLLAAGPNMGAEQTHKGYYRDPAVHGDTIVFTSEGDLWTVSVHGGAAQRLTTAPGTESGFIDVRHNHGGNIDSWLLGKLLREAWFYFQPRVGNPSWNMQYAFRGHIVVLCDHETASDGEAFAEGFRRLKLGKVIGTRTWGGEIWLSGS